MEDLGFNGTGSKFNTRFGSNSDIVGKQLNDMSYGIQAGLPQPGVGSGQSISYTPGGALFSPDSDPNIYGRYQYNADPPQFKCVVYVDASGGEGNLKYYLKIARGMITGVGTDFPFTQQDNQGNPGNEIEFFPTVTTAQQRMIFDVALSPTDSRTAGPQSSSTSAWMASDGKFELDPEAVSYYVTVSLLEYNDKLNWYSDNAFIQFQPWVSILKKTGASKTAIFSPCYATTVTDYIYTNPSDGSGFSKSGSAGYLPTLIGYQMKVIARIDWNATDEMWTVRQEMVGPISLESNPCSAVRYNNQADPPSPIYSDYATAKADKFSQVIGNYNYVNSVFKDTTFDNDSDILAEEWWYDPKTI